MCGRLTKERVELLIVFFGVLAILLVLFGAVVELPYSRYETVNNYPHGPTVRGVENLTLRPGEFRFFSLDWLNENNSLVYVKVERATNPIIFRIESYIGTGFNGSRTLAFYPINTTWPLNPFEYFWTPPWLGACDFYFDNPYDTATNITVKILVYYYNYEWQVETTYYRPPLDKAFAYAGIALIIVAITPTVYDLYKTRKEKPKKPFWQEEAYKEKVREQEEKGKLQ
ncbi:MAG: hypothetical protein OEY22_06340 [Candidatus Bathyarchaeota archaeon]|nr:hypothetical protein [Candidatus Bathyarchaeota archaeon]MDH5787996.1 hypothetical protein [Candidatus Bathyarchaeota archaeon]